MDATALSYAPAIGSELRFNSAVHARDHLKLKADHLHSLLNVLTDIDLKAWSDETLASLLCLLTSLIAEIKSTLAIAYPAD